VSFNQASTVEAVLATTISVAGKSSGIRTYYLVGPYVVILSIFEMLG